MGERKNYKKVTVFLDGVQLFVFCLCAVQPNRGFEDKMFNSKLETAFVSDFAEFYDYKHVCFIDKGDPLSCDPVDGRETRARSKTPLLLLKDMKAYFSCLSFHCSFCQRSGLSNETESFCQDSASSNGPLLHHRHAVIELCSGLIVQRLLSIEDLILFKKIFGETETDAHWLLLSDENYKELLLQVYLPLDSKVTVAVNTNDNNNEVVLLQSYQADPKLPLRISEMGNWTFHHKDQISLNENKVDILSLSNDTQLFPVSKRLLQNLEAVQRKKKKLRHGVMNSLDGEFVSKRTDLTGVHLQCTTVEDKPGTLLTHQEDGSVLVSGFVGEIFKLLQEATNFSYTCYPVRDGNWGSLMTDGRWNGMVGEVVDGVADIAIASLDMTVQRMLALDFLNVLKREKVVVITKKVSSGDFLWTAYTKQFQPKVWSVLFALVMGITLALNISIKLSPTQPPESFLETCLTAMCIFFGQGSSMNALSSCVRMVVLLSVLVHTIMLAHYTTNLVSSIAARKPIQEFSSLDDVAKDPSISVGVIAHTSVESMLKGSDIHAHQVIWRRIINGGPRVNNMEEAIVKIKAGKYMHLLHSIATSFKYGHDCSLTALPETLFATQMSIALKKGSHLTHSLNTVLYEIHSSGLLDKLWRQWGPEEYDCSTLEVPPVEFNAILTPLLLLSGLTVLSLVIFCVEHFILRFSERV